MVRAKLPLLEDFVMEVVLSPDLQEFVDELIATGRFASPGEVVREALDLLRTREELTPQEMEWLRREIAVGIDQLNRGEGIELKTREELAAYFEDVKARGQARWSARKDAR